MSQDCNAPAERRQIIAIENLSYAAGGRQILSDVNLEVCRGDFMAITGPNGGGKTTLLRLILKLLKPSEGKITYFDSCGNPTEHLRIGYLPQKNMIDSRFPITVKEVIASGLMQEKGLSDRERRERIDHVIDLTSLGSYIDNPIGALSGGQLQRALLGRAIVSDPPLLVLDEPLSYLDKYFEERTYEILDRIKDRHTILLVSHEMSRIATMATRHIIVNGNVHECHGKHRFVPCECE